MTFDGDKAVDVVRLDVLGAYDVVLFVLSSCLSCIVMELVNIGQL